MPAVQALRLIWIQQFCRGSGPDGEKVIWREDEHGLPPGRDRLASPYDLDVRYSEKRGHGWTGYKAHYSETCHGKAGDDPGTGLAALPDLITGTQTTHAAVPDVMMTQVIHDDLETAGLAPGEHAADSGYTSAGLLIKARARGIVLVGPLTAGASPQARSGGYVTSMFAIDWDARTVTCPQGAASSTWAPCTQRGTETIVVRFPAAACGPCPARDKCTTSARGRQLSLRPRETHEAVEAARAEHSTLEWRQKYAIRAGVEGTIAQATHVTGIRQARYPGLPKTTFEHNAAATAINFIRLDSWWTGNPMDRTRTSNFQRLDLALAT
jgi:hypothetical protein